MTTKKNAQRPPADRFAGVVYEDPKVEIGRNHYGERVVRIDLRNADFPGVLETSTVLSLDAAIALRDLLNADDAFVAPEDACPHCNERNQDQLAWDADGVEVRCQTCGQTYRPSMR